MRRVVISGPTGSIGISLIRECIKNSVEVLAICHRGSKRIKEIPKNLLVKIVELNLEEYREFSLEGEAYDCFFHFAWEGTAASQRNDAEKQAKNITYTVEAVRLAYRLGCKTFLGAGSQAEYGRQEEKLTPYTYPNPEIGYGIAKLSAGRLSQLECEQLGIRHNWVRIVSVYGPGDGDETMIVGALKKMLQGKKASFSKGEQLWDYLFSEDAAKAIYLVGEKGRHGIYYPIASGEEKPLKDYIEIMASIVRDVSGMPVLLGIGDIPYQERQVMRLCGDIQELMQDTGFKPEVCFKDGIIQMIEYYKKTHEEKRSERNI